MAETTVRSELNAVVWKIEAAPGQAVNAGDTLMILESMKMEIPVAAPRAGTVKAILVSEKDEVAEGQPLVILQF
jgi:biotin carboxyl carrier protein